MITKWLRGHAKSWQSSCVLQEAVSDARANYFGTVLDMQSMTSGHVLLATAADQAVITGLRKHAKMTLNRAPSWDL